jgi:hypothetical protein
MTEWRFRRMQPGEMNIDPIESEFFSTEALDSLSDALVREAIQNSLDARRRDVQVRVRIAFLPPAEAARGDVEARYLTGLSRHLGASGSGLRGLPDAPLDLLVIEDFGTRGLQGDPAQSEDEDLASSPSRNDFYFFWRNVGRSGKSAAELGRWGLGKTVFPAASRINAFFALTERADDRRRLLMGQAVLRIHKVEGRRYYPYGYFGDFEGEFATPITEPEALGRFCRDLRIARSPGEPGLSVVVPWPDPELSPATVLPSVVRHYFVPILAGDLAVEIVDPSGTRRLEARTLSRFLPECEGSGGAGLERLVALARFAQGLARDAHIRIPPPPLAAAPRWSETAFEGLESEVRAAFDAGDALAFTVPVWVKPVDAQPMLSEFDVYLERDPSLSGADEHFVREGITVSGVRGALPKGLRTLVIARDAPLAALLGDAENPAHTEWQERSVKFRDRYRHGPYTLRYVRNAPREIARALVRPAAGRNEHLLRHLFSLEVPTEESVIERERARSASRGSGAAARASLPALPTGASCFLLHGLTGGFRLVGEGGSAVPRHVVVEIAYEVRRGNPFAQYQPPDFALGEPPVRVSARGALIARQQANSLVLRIEDPAFELSVAGFDPHRDIRVRVAEASAEAMA